VDIFSVCTNKYKGYFSEQVIFTYLSDDCMPSPLVGEMTAVTAMTRVTRFRRRWKGWCFSISSEYLARRILLTLEEIINAIYYFND